MPLAKTDITVRETPPAIPTYQFTDDQLAPFLGVLPPLTAATRPNWHLSRRRRFHREIAALHPTDRLQRYIAVHLVVARLVVRNLMGRARARWNSPEEARWLGRQAARMMRIGDRLERALRREQKIAARGGGGRAVSSPGLLAREAPCRNDALQPEALDLAGVAPALPAVPFGVIGPVRAKATKGKATKANATTAPGQRRQRVRRTTSGAGPALGGVQ